jgi:D-alanine-D-alanine ligase
VRTDASNGITAHSVVSNVKELVRRVRFVRDTFAQSALVEEFIDGRELNVALLAVSPTQWAVLPVAEIVFQNFGDRPRIVGYEAKWVPGTVEYNGTVPKCPADLPDELAAEIRELAVRAARVLGLRDYGRVDLRLRADNVPFVLEGNPNPDISHDAGFARSALASGRTHEQAILEMVARAIERLHARDRS